MNNMEWGTDYFSRTAKAESDMYKDRQDETNYIYTDNDSEGRRLENQLAPLTEWQVLASGRCEASDMLAGRPGNSLAGWGICTRCDLEFFDATIESLVS